MTATLIIILVVIGIPLKYVHAIWPSVLPVGTSLQKFGADINLYLGTAHGFIYMAFVLVALLLGLRARWPFAFLVVTLLCGTVPFLSFWAIGCLTAAITSFMVWKSAGVELVPWVIPEVWVSSSAMVIWSMLGPLAQ